MKYIFPFFAFTILTFISEAQVTITKPTGDLLKENYLGYSYKRYLNKKFYVVPVASIYRQKGYRNFFVKPNNLPTDYNGDPEHFIDIEILRTIVYKPDTGYWRPVITTHDELAEKELTLINIIKEHSKIFFQFSISGTEETVYYRYDSEMEIVRDFNIEFPFILVEYFEYLNKKHSGGQYILRRCHESLQNAVDGNEVSINSDKIWTVRNITLNEERSETGYELSATLESEGTQVLYPLDDLTYEECVITKERMDTWIKIYGKNDYELIVRGYIKRGWNETMVRLSQGKPHEIKEEYSYDIWVYKRYLGVDKDFKAEYKVTKLYFKNGVLSHWEM